MSDSMSTASYGISSMSYVSNTNLNPLKSIHISVINKIKKEIDVYQGVTSKCKAIWDALQKNDIAGSRLSEKVIEVVFKRFEEDLYNYTRVSSLKDFMRLFDVDRDGFLNEDEQIRIFSYVKERVQLTANNALIIQAYASFRSLMKEVRDLEASISIWQNDLREHVHESQLIRYREIGDERIDEFCQKYEQEFSALMLYKLNRRQGLEKEAIYEMSLLDERLSDPAEYMRIKPVSKVKLYQMQEKLVALEERVEEALDYRKELNELEVNEKERVDKLIQTRAETQRMNLRRKQEKSRRQLEIKLDEMQNKMIIRIKEEYYILLKKNNLHENEIKRLQTMMAKWAIKKATFCPELKRTKVIENKRNQILGEHRQVFKKASSEVTVEEENLPPQNSKMTAKTLLHQTSNFEISKKSAAEMPVNSSSLLRSRSDNKISQYLVSNKSLSQISLCRLYDENLSSVSQVVPTHNQNLYRCEMSRKRNFILSKIL